MQHIYLIIIHESPSMRQALADFFAETRTGVIVRAAAPEDLAGGLPPGPPPILCLGSYTAAALVPPAVVSQAQGWFQPWANPGTSLCGVKDQVTPWPTAGTDDLLAALDHLIASAR